MILAYRILIKGELQNDIKKTETILTYLELN
jgi:hypothetical protein